MKSLLQTTLAAFTIASCQPHTSKPETPTKDSKSMEKEFPTDLKTLTGIAPQSENSIQNPNHSIYLKIDMSNPIISLPTPDKIEKFSFCATTWIQNSRDDPGRLFLAATYSPHEEESSLSHPLAIYDETPSQRLSPLYFSPISFALITSSNIDNSSDEHHLNFESMEDNDIDYLSRINQPIPLGSAKGWSIRMANFANFKNRNTEFKSLELFCCPSNTIARFHTWIILPDRALGPIETRIGSDSTTFEKDLEEQNRTAPPRDRLPPEYQKDQRTWVEQRENLNAIQPGIHLDMIRAKGGTQLVLKYRLPWLRQDSVHLDVDPIVLQGMEVPKGIKEVSLVITSPHGNQDFQIAVPAHPLGDGTCAGSFLVNPKSMLANFDIRVYSVFAVANGHLAGPLMAERNGVHWLQPGLPKPKLRTKAWDPSEE